MRTKKPDIQEFEKVCNARGGIMTSIAASFGVNRATVFRWCEKHPKYKEALEASRDVFIDIAETNLQTLVKGTPIYKEDENGKRVFDRWQVPPSESAIIFTLRTIGRKRGYVEKQELDHTTNGKEIILDPFAKMRENHGIEG